MNGTIGVRNMVVSCVFGVPDTERQTEQPIEVDIAVDYDITRAAATDAIAAALDYSRVVSMVEENLRWQKYHLLEAAGQGLVEMIIQAYPFVSRVRLELRKPEVLPGTAVSFLRLDTLEGAPMDEAATVD